MFGSYISKDDFSQYDNDGRDSSIKKLKAPREATAEGRTRNYEELISG